MTGKAKSDGSAPDMQKMLGQLISGVYLIGVLVLGVYALFFLRAGISGDPGDWGTLGDYFGGMMNPVVSFATLVVAYAVWKQQREELQQTKEALKEQAKTSEQQRREQRFFDLMNVYYRTLESVSSTYVRTITKPGRSSTLALRITETVGSELVRLTGKAAMSNELNVIESHREREENPTWEYLLQAYLSADKASQPALLADLRSHWRSAQTNSDLSHFFQVVTLVLRESEDLLGKDHRRYAGLFVTQLSESELALIAYYMWLDESGAQLAKHGQRYCVLQHMKHRRAIFSKVLPPDMLASVQSTPAS